MQNTLNHSVEVKLSPNRIGLFLLAVVALLSSGHILVHLLGKFIPMNEPPLWGFFRFFNMDIEGNLPTYISALNLFFAAGLCGFIFCHEFMLKKRSSWHWLGMGALLLFISFDEAAGIHDSIIDPLSIYWMGRGEGIMYYRWYLFFMPVVAIVGLLYIPFLKRLPLLFSSRFFLAGAVFLSGAVGMEMVGATLKSQGRSIGISVLFEETLEMLAVVILIHTLLLYISKADYALKLQVSGNPRR